VDTRPPTSPSASGYVIVLLGVVGFMVGCFFPYLSGIIGAPGDDSVSLIQLLWTPAEGQLEQVGALLNLFAGAGTVGALAL
jgi:hypothetical protein